VLVNLIAATTNRKGLEVGCVLDTARYPAGVKVSDAEMQKLNLKRHEFHGDGNHTLPGYYHLGPTGLRSAARCAMGWSLAARAARAGEERLKATRKAKGSPRFTGLKVHPVSRG
jgi:hypothetical protein